MSRKQESLLSLNGIGSSIGSLMIKDKFINDMISITDDSIQIKSLPLYKTKLGEDFKKEDFIKGIISIDSEWSILTDEIFDLAFKQTPAPISNIVALPGTINARTLELDPVFSNEGYGVTMETGVLETDKTVTLANGDKTSAVESFAVFGFDSPALRNIVGTGSVQVTGTKNIEAFKEWLKWASEMALKADKITTFVQHIE
jgi:hypothetical protein